MKALLSKTNTLTTEQEMKEYMNQQTDYLMEHYRQSEETLEKFQTTLIQQAEKIKVQTSESMKDLQKQAGKMKEEFSCQLSSEKRTLNRHCFRLTMISLIPTLVLVIWELIRFIWLQN